MYVSMMQIQFQPCVAYEAALLWRESVLPVLKQQPGWKDASFSLDSATGRGMLFALWETESQAYGYEACAEYYQEFGRLMALGAGQLTHMVYRLGTSEEETFTRSGRTALCWN